MEATINFSRPGKGNTRYIEQLVDDDAVRLKTINILTQEFSQKWCEEVWWKNGAIRDGTLIGSVEKTLFYREWFSVMQLKGVKGEILGCYVDIDTPMQVVDGEYCLTDLFLDLWVCPEGIFIELDRDEFEHGYQLGLLTDYQYGKANQVIDQLMLAVSNGEFFLMIQ